MTKTVHAAVDVVALMLGLIALGAVVAIMFLWQSSEVGPLISVVGIVASIAVLVCALRASGRRPAAESLKTLFWGVLWLVAACSYWGYEMGNPVNELALIRAAKTTSGYVTDASEDPPEESKPWTWEIIYKYHTTDGREHQGRQHGDGRLPSELFYLPHPVEIEYLPYKPTVSRVAGTGHSDVIHWLVLKVCGGTLLLVLFASPGIYLIREGLRGLKEQQTTSLRPGGE